MVGRRVPRWRGRGDASSVIERGSESVVMVLLGGYVKELADMVEAVGRLVDLVTAVMVGDLLVVGTGLASVVADVKVVVPSALEKTVVVAVEAGRSFLAADLEVAKHEKVV